MQEPGAAGETEEEESSQREALAQHAKDRTTDP